MQTVVLYCLQNKDEKKSAHAQYTHNFLACFDPLLIESAACPWIQKAVLSSAMLNLGSRGRWRGTTRRTILSSQGSSPSRLCWVTSSSMIFPGIRCWSWSMFGDFQHAPPSAITSSTLPLSELGLCPSPLCTSQRVHCSPGPVGGRSEVSDWALINMPFPPHLWGLLFYFMGEFLVVLLSPSVLFLSDQLG